MRWGSVVAKNLLRESFNFDSKFNENVCEGSVVTTNTGISKGTFKTLDSIIKRFLFFILKGPLCLKAAAMSNNLALISTKAKTCSPLISVIAMSTSPSTPSHNTFRLILMEFLYTPKRFTTISMYYYSSINKSSNFYPFN